MKTAATSALLAALPLTFWVSLASAQAPPDPPPMPGNNSAAGPAQANKLVAPADASPRPQGWTPGIAVGGTLNLTDTRAVVGQQDGTSFTLGAAIDAALEFNEGIHEWRNVLKVGAGATVTPALGEFVKTSDALFFESIYLLHAIEELGPFARFALDTHMFPSLDIRPTATNYAIANLDGTTTSLTGRRLYLTDSFIPLTLKQSIGGFAQPVNNDRIKLEFRLGVGAQETFAEGNLAINDDAATADITEVKTLSDFYMIGAEGVANAWGTFDEGKRISYTVGIGVLVPFVSTDVPGLEDKGAFERTNVEGIAGLNVKLVEWASLDYKLTVIRQPLLVEDVQVTNMLLLTLGAAWGSKAPAPPPPPPPCEPPAAPPPAEKPAEAPPAPPPADAAPTPPPAAAAPPAPAPAAPAPAAPAPAPANP
jgi:hypothetical protein